MEEEMEPVAGGEAEKSRARGNGGGETNEL